MKTRSMMVFLVLVLATAGCAWSVGGRTETVRNQPTLGQELLDLKAALDKGAVTEEEYHHAKADLLSRRTPK